MPTYRTFHLPTCPYFETTTSLTAYLSSGHLLACLHTNLSLCLHINLLLPAFQSLHLPSIISISPPNSLPAFQSLHLTACLQFSISFFVRIFTTLTSPSLLKCFNKISPYSYPFKWQSFHLSTSEQFIIPVSQPMVPFDSPDDISFSPSAYPCGRLFFSQHVLRFVNKSLTLFLFASTSS